MASKITQSRHWAHISADTYDIPAPALAPGAVQSRAVKEHNAFRDTDTARARRGYARSYMAGKGVAFLGLGLGTDEVTTLRSITPVHIKKEHDRARAHTPSRIIPPLRKVREQTEGGGASKRVAFPQRNIENEIAPTLIWALLAGFLLHFILVRRGVSRGVYGRYAQSLTLPLRSLHALLLLPLYAKDVYGERIAARPITNSAGLYKLNSFI
jgi:hypothetical protein